MTAALEGMSDQQNAPDSLYPRERTGTHFTEGWVGPRDGLDGRKSRPHGDSIPDRPARSSVAIPTELPGPRELSERPLSRTHTRGSRLTHILSIAHHI